MLDCIDRSTAFYIFVVLLLSPMRLVQRNALQSINPLNRTASSCARTHDAGQECKTEYNIVIIAHYYTEPRNIYFS